MYKDAFTVFGPMDVWCLDQDGWIPASYDVYEPDDVTFLNKDWMKEMIEGLQEEGYFYDFVEFPLIP